GSDPPTEVAGLASRSVSVTGRVNSAVPHLARASVAVVPLHAGGGTRLKILEAFASGVPVVSTTIGAEGLDLVPGEHLLIADTPDTFASAVIDALRDTGDTGLPSGYSIAGAYELAASRYDWGTAVVPALVAAHDEAIERFQGEQ
ncbi:MAG: glycosyltransferase family 4 protein, partial [Thermomicrobiales bacterium]